MAKKNNNGSSNPKGKTQEVKKEVRDSNKGAGKARSNDSKPNGKPKLSNSDSNLGSYVGMSNDPSWYLGNRRLVEDASKIPFGYQLGAPITSHDPDALLTYDRWVVPGVMALEMINIPGVARTASDGVNLAAAALFQHIRKNLSTVAQYAAADVMMYVLGIDEIYSMYSNILRVFGIINAYSATNLYYPNTLLRAGYGFDDQEIANIKKHVNDYRSWFNNLIYKASTLYLPTDFTVTMRHAWLYSNYFMDVESLKGQLYIHRMMGYHQIDETYSNNGTALKTYVTPTTLEGMLTSFEACIEAYRDSDSMLKIAADMRRAFDGRQSWKLAYCDEAYLVLPSYSKDVLSQIHNATITRLPADPIELSTWDVTQSVNKNTILCTPSWSVSDEGFPKASWDNLLDYARTTKILDFKWDSPTVEDVVEATRNCVLVQKMGEDTTYLALMSSGVDVVWRATVYQKVEPDDIYNDGFTAFHGTNIYTGDAPTVPTLEPDLIITPTDLCLWSVFDWAPIITIEAVTGDALGEVISPFGDLANYTMLEPDTLVRLNDNILCSMWAIPELGLFNPGG